MTLIWTRLQYDLRHNVFIVIVWPKGIILLPTMYCKWIRSRLIDLLLRVRAQFYIRGEHHWSILIVFDNRRRVGSDELFPQSCAQTYLRILIWRSFISTFGGADCHREPCRAQECCWFYPKKKSAWCWSHGSSWSYNSSHSNLCSVTILSHIPIEAVY